MCALAPWGGISYQQHCTASPVRLTSCGSPEGGHHLFSFCLLFMIHVDFKEDASSFSMLALCGVKLQSFRTANCMTAVEILFVLKSYSVHVRSSWTSWNTAEIDSFKNTRVSRCIFVLLFWANFFFFFSWMWLPSLCLMLLFKKILCWIGWCFGKTAYVPCLHSIKQD